MHVAQVAKQGFVFFAHAPREVRVTQMLIPRRLRHVLQDVQAALDRVPPRRRQLFPRRKHVVSDVRSEEHTSELQSHHDLVCRLLLEKKNTTTSTKTAAC